MSITFVCFLFSSMKCNNGIRELEELICIIIALNFWKWLVEVNERGCHFQGFCIPIV